MKNSLNDLNNHLFEQIERLNDEELVGTDLEEEILRSKAVSNVAKKIIDNATLMLDATKLGLNEGVEELPKTLGIKSRSNKDGS